MENEDYADFDDPDDTQFELQEELNPKDAEKQGSLKTSENLDDGGLVYYSDDDSGFTVSVERLLCVDGWEDSTKKQLMTLMILKIMVASNSEQKVSSITAKLEFTNTKNGESAKPDIEAWAPFKDMVRSNETSADIKNTFSAKAEGGGSGGGGDAKVGVDYEHEISWAKKYFDEGHAYPVMNRVTGRRSGVRWVLKTNKLQEMGVPPDMIVGVLFKREKDAPYLVKFDIRLKGGFLYNLAKGTEKRLGLGPGRTRPYLVKPSATPVTRYEGAYILPYVDQNALGKLRVAHNPMGSSNLILVWEIEKPTAEAPVEK